MALPAAFNQLSIANIQTEFGGSNPAALSEYYKNGTYVTSGDTAPNVPTSGMIKVSNFFSAAKVSGSFPITNSFTSGNGSITAPVGATNVSIYVLGGGGSGGGSDPYESAFTGGGGGGAGYAEYIDLAVTGGVTQFFYDVGTAGQGYYAASGEAGGTSSVNDGSTIFMYGYGGGGGSVASTSADGSPGPGGSATGGTTNVNGADGIGTSGGNSGAPALGGNGGGGGQGTGGNGGDALVRFVWTNTGGGGGGGCCFAADTQITLGDGSTKPISMIEVGEVILSYNLNTQQIETNEVDEIITRVDRAMYEYVLENNTTLKASDDHPLFVVGRGFCSMNPSLTMKGYKNLLNVQVINVGYSLLDQNGNAVKIKQINPIHHPDMVYTLNNKFKSSPTFFANGMLTY